MVAAPDAAIADDVNLSANGIGNFGYLVKGRPPAVELPPTMVADHDGGCADIDRALCVLN